MPHRSLQLGLGGEAARRYADEWIVSVTDVTPLAHAVHGHVRDGDLDRARHLLPPETPYPVPDEKLAYVRPPVIPGGRRQAGGEQQPGCFAEGRPPERAQDACPFLG